MLSLEEYTWAFRVIGTRSFGKFMPNITLFPVGELLNHDNVQTYYIYQYPHETPDSSTRYSGIVDENDHDEDLVTNDTIVNLTSELILNINEDLCKSQPEPDKYDLLKSLCQALDQKEESETNEHKKYRPPDMDLTENDDKEASICAGPNEHYLRGSEVYMSYGRYSNKQLLSTYGFSLKQNYYNYALLKIQLKELGDTEEQTEFLSKIDAFCVFKLKKNVLGKLLLRTLRGLYWKSEYPSKAFLDPVLPELEVKVLTKAIKLTHEKLSKFPTTYEEDLNILNQHIPLRKYFAVLYRSQLKDILMTQVVYFETAKKAMQRVLDGESIENVKNSIDLSEIRIGIAYIDHSLVHKVLSEYFKDSNFS
jgi:hypothetical protein